MAFTSSPMKTVLRIATGLVCLAIAAPGATDDAAWRALCAGGVTLLLRHTSTEPGVGDPQGFRLEDCTTQRNLSEAGRAEAVSIGRTVRERGVQISLVRTSQWCRCRDTARLLNLGEPDDWPALNSFFEVADDQADRRTAEVRRYLTELSSDATVLLVTHQVNITALTGLVPAMGEGIVVARAADDASAPLRVIGRIRFPTAAR
jgi:phosphohistidine phosphatase SixA